MEKFLVLCGKVPIVREVKLGPYHEAETSDSSTLLEKVIKVVWDIFENYLTSDDVWQ